MQDKIRKKILGHNRLINKIVNPVPLNPKLIDVPIIKFSVDENDFLNWADKYAISTVKYFGTPLHKKVLELYTTFKLLEIDTNECYLDAAGGQFTYMEAIKCSKKYVLDINFAPEARLLEQLGIKLIEGSVSQMPFPDKSIDKISCHHSIEHFQNDVDIGFIKEVTRVLKPSGRCVIIPLLISDKNYLISDKKNFTYWEEKGENIFDQTSTLPGGNMCGNFARVYSLDSFKERLISKIPANFKVSIYSLESNRETIPRKDYFFNKMQATINCSYKALSIERIS